MGMILLLRIRVIRVGVDLIFPVDEKGLGGTPPWGARERSLSYCNIVLQGPVSLAFGKAEERGKQLSRAFKLIVSDDLVFLQKCLNCRRDEELYLGHGHNHGGGRARHGWGAA